MGEGDRSRRRLAASTGTSRGVPKWNSRCVGIVLASFGFAALQADSITGQVVDLPFAADLERAGVTLSELDERFVGPDDIADGRSFADVGALLESRHIPRLRVETISGGHHGMSFPLCVMFGRYREGDPSTGCMALRVDGRPATQAEVMALSVSQLHSIIVLRNSEAMRAIGSDGQPGAVLLYRQW